MLTCLDKLASIAEAGGQPRHLFLCEWQLFMYDWNIFARLASVKRRLLFKEIEPALKLLDKLPIYHTPHNIVNTSV